MMLSHSDLTKTSTGFVLFYALQIARLSLSVTFFYDFRFSCHFL